MDLVSLSVSAGTALATSLATNAGKVPIETLDNLWYLTFRKFNNFVSERRAQDTLNLEEYKISIANKVSQVSEENLIKPAMSIIGPALEASKYYIDEEILREMFANVVAASMDDSKTNTLHHSFVEIIKQLSPQDAQNLLILKRNPNRGIVNFIKLYDNGQGYEIINSNVFIGDLPDIVTGSENATSVTNLERLGLVKISFEENYNDKRHYEPYRQSSYFRDKSIDNDFRDNEFDIKEGTMRLTPLGDSFISICL